MCVERPRVLTIRQIMYAIYICVTFAIYLSLKVITSQPRYESTNQQLLLTRRDGSRFSNTPKRPFVLETPKTIYSRKVSTLNRIHKNETHAEPTYRHEESSPFKPTFVNGTDINPQMFHFFQLKKNEPKDMFVNQHSYKYTLNSKVCKTGSTFLVVIIHSTPTCNRRRLLIRTTFGSVGSYRQKNLAIVFMMGSVLDRSLQEDLSGESMTFGDIVQGNFIDSYKNLTRKHIMAMHWFKYNCNAEYILKLDDDTFINPYRMVNYILKIRPTGREIWCTLLEGKGPVRIWGSKWYTPVKEYPFPILPPFCLGFAYIATPAAWDAMYKVSETSRPMTMDDVFVSVVLAMKAKVRKFDFSNILIPCPQNKTFDKDQLNRNAVVIDRAGDCGDMPFNEWIYIKKPSDVD